MPSASGLPDVLYADLYQLLAQLLEQQWVLPQTLKRKWGCWEGVGTAASENETFTEYVPVLSYCIVT